MKSHFSALQFVIILIFCSPGFVLADVGGRTGRTLKSSTAGCGTCHGSSATPSVIAVLAGPDTVYTSQSSIAYTLTVSGGPAIGSGCDIAAKNGALNAVSSYLRVSNGELTQRNDVLMTGGSVVFQFTYTAPATAGTDTLYAVGLSTDHTGGTGGDAWNWAPSKRVVVIASTSAPVAPILAFPANGATNQSRSPVIRWRPSASAATYRLQLSADSLFTTTILDDSTIVDTSRSILALNSATKYFWRVNAKNIAGTSPWSTRWDFTTVAFSPLTGSKTIGGSTPDYTTIKQALQDLLLRGTAAPGVTFLIRGGTYTEDSLIVSTLTSSVSAPITIKPATGATVVINVTPVTNALPFAIKIDTTTYVTIDGSNNGTTTRNMTINGIGTNAEKGIWVSGQSHFATIKNCIVTSGAMSSSTYRGIDLLFNGSVGGNPHNCLVENNLVRNAFYPIRAGGRNAADSIYGLTIRNNVADSNANGIYTTTTTGTLIYNNDVSILVGASATMYGIYIGNNTNYARVYNNRVHDLKQLSTGSSITYAIYTNTGSGSYGKNGIFNNFVWGINVPSTGTGAIYGIYVSETNTTIPDTVAFNTVNLTGTGGGNRTSTAFYKASVTGPVIVKNNIFLNTRSDGTTGKATAIGKTSAPTVLISDNNNLYVGTPDSLHQTGRILTSTYFATVADWRAGNSSDTSSVAENAPFASATDLHLRTNVVTQMESGGKPVSGITKDIDGDTRNATTPDIGADEGNFLGADLTAPAISHTPLSNTPSTSGRVALATISDPSGVARGAGSPRLWHKISTDPTYVSVVADSIRGNSFYFTIPGRPVGTSVRYYLAAQDSAAGNNVGTVPIGGSGINPPGSTPPPTTFSYVIQGPLVAGTYTVGTSGNFPSLDSAFRKISIDGIAGPVVFSLTGTSDTVQALGLVGPITGASAANKITISPATGRIVRIASAGPHTIRLQNVSYMTIDGISTTGGTRLTIENNIGDGVVLDGNSDNNVIKNLTVRTAFTGGAAIRLDSTVAGSPDSNLVKDNIIPSAHFGIYVDGGVARAIGNRLTGNIIGSATDSVSEFGISCRRIIGMIIDNNRIENVRQPAPADDIVGLHFSSPHINARVYSNVIRNVKVGAASTSGTYAAGMYVFSTSTTENSNSDFFNNMVYDIDNLSSSRSATIRGIYAGTGSNDSICYNTVYLTGTGVTPKTSGAIYTGTHTNQVFLNNIAVNTRIEPDSGHAVAFYKGSTSSTIVSNYNDLYVLNRPGSFIAANTSANWDTTLARWRTRGYDSSSVSVMANFRTPDLHIDSTIISPINRGGVALPGITVDFDGQLRSSTTPDIGADEFGTLTSVHQDLSSIPEVFELKQNYPNPFNPTTTLDFTIPKAALVSVRIYNMLGQQVATLVDESKPVGRYTVQWNAIGVSSGVYFCRMTSGDYSGMKKLLLLK